MTAPLVRPLVDGRNLAALAAAAAWRAVHRGVAVVAVTGSSGKTTSRECLAAILRRRGQTLATAGNRNASYRLSKTLLQLRSSHRYAVIEIGIDAPGQMRRWAGAVRPDIAVVHTVNLTHREALPTLEITAREKARVLDALRPGGVAVLNGEDPYVRAMISPQVSRTVFFGDCDGSIARATDVRASLDAGLRFELHTPAGSRAVRLNLYGAHWTAAVLGAVAAALVLEVPLDDIVSGLSAVRPQTARMQPVPLAGGAIVVRDEHNSTPISFLAAVAFMRGLPNRRRWLVLREVRHLDDDPDGRFRWIARETAGAFEGALVVGEHAEVASAAFREAGLPASRVVAVSSTREASARLGTLLERGDVALVRGRGHFDHLTRIVYGQFGAVACWKDVCRLKGDCDTCPSLGARDGAGHATVLPAFAPSELHAE